MPTFDDFVPHRRFQDGVAISPDGTTVAYSSNDAGQYHLRTIAVTGGDSPRSLTDDPDRSVRAMAWSPDGKSIAFNADYQGNEQYQIHVLDIPTGTDTRLSADDTRQYELAAAPFDPTGRYVAAAGNDRDPMVQDVIVFDLHDGSERRFPSQPGAPALPVAFSPDGRWLAIEIQRANIDISIALVDLEDDDTDIRVITPLDGMTFRAGPWLPDSSGLYVRTNTGAEFLALARMSLDGTVTVVHAPDADVEAVTATPDATTVAWVVNDGGSSALHVRSADAAAADAGGGVDHAPPLPTGVLESVSLTADGTRLVGLFGTAARPRDLVSIDIATGSITYLTDSRPPVFTAPSGVRAVEPELIAYASHDGRMIPAWLYRPHGDAEPRGVVVAVHGGPESQERAEYNYSGLYQYLLSNGVGILAPNVRGSTGYGLSYQRLILRDWGGGELGDLDHAVRYLSDLDWVDATRIAVFGGSFGGFAALSCLSRLPDRFAAGVSIVGPSNLVTLTRSVPPSWRPLMADWVGDPDDDHDFLMSRSPITYADRIVAPLYVIQGANDPRVIKAESDQIVDALRARGVEVRYDVYDDEGHGFTKRANEIRAVRDVGRFLLDHVG